MKRYIYTLILLIFSISTYSQELTKHEKIEQLMAQKVAFITNKLELTPIEAQKFWPIYNEFFKKKEMLNNEKKKVTHSLQLNWQSLTTEKKEELSDRIVAFKIEEANLEKIYHEKFKTVLPIDKVILLYNAENQFKNYLLKQIKNNASKSINSQSKEFKRK